MHIFLTVVAMTAWVFGWFGIGVLIGIFVRSRCDY